MSKLVVGRREVTLGLVASALAGCVHPERLSALPQNITPPNEVFGIPNARFYLSDVHAMEAEGRQALAREIATQGANHASGSASYLAVSGGGDDGAFGAGLLVGWSERGTRPTFNLVTGISTGALTAPFAFLGRGYDPMLRAVYTTTNQDDVLVRRSLLAAITDDALADTTPLFGLITHYMDDGMIAAIAHEYGRGRLLLIATTDLDRARPVIWNIGAIAGSRYPQAPILIRRILLASSAIPGAFPPVMFDIESGGHRYQELHVDGGSVAQTFLYPPMVSVRHLRPRARTAYIIRNSRLQAPFAQTERQTLSIAGRAISTLIAASGVSDAYRIYLTTKRDGVGYNLAYIGSDFTEPYAGPFDRGYMTKLFEYGRARGRAGHPWRKTPPGYAV
jgi:predicted acylesterase/phospholipase RssA